MTLEPKDALTQYHFAERLKLDIMMIAHQYLTIPSLKKEEKAGAKRVLINITEALAADSHAAAAFTGCDDFNTAVAYIGTDRNANAMRILEKLEKTDKVNYLLAVLYSRQGDFEKAVECYVKSCRQNPSYVFRGNLDPEISVLIKTYGLNSESDDEVFQ